MTELTAADGDLRVGIDLLRRAGLQAEMRGSRTIAIEDIDTAYEKSKYVHLSRRLQGLSQTESALVEVVAADSGATAGEIYELFHAETGLGYTRYSEVVNKLDDLGIIDASYTDIEGRGRTRSMSLAYDADAVMERL